MTEITVSGRAISPGLCCGPLVRNHRRLRPEDVRGAILVAERAAPDDLVRLRAAAGTLTLGGAVLSHVSLLSRELGKPSVALEPDGQTQAPSRGSTVLRVSVAGGRSVLALAAGDLAMLDGDRGVVRVPGGRSRALRRALREVFDALRALPNERAIHRLDLADPAVAAFAVETATAYGLVRSGAKLDRLVERASAALGEGRWAELRDRLTRRATERLEWWCRNTREAAAGVEDMGELGRLEHELSSRIERMRRLFSELGSPAPLAVAGPAALLRTLAERRAGLSASLERHVVESLGWSAEQQAARAGRLHELLRRARGSGLDAARLGALEQVLERVRPGRADAARRPLVVSLEDGHGDADSCGGKAAGLCGLGSVLPAGCSVPPGFVVTTAAYRLHLLGEAGDRLRSARKKARGSRALSRLARAAIWSAPLPEEVSAAILDGLGGLSAQRLAVRASSPLEGGPAGSLAGLFDTFLGVRGVDETIDRIRRAWASSWDTPVLDALAVSGGVPEDPAVAVLVQRMIETRVAGVMLTRAGSAAPDTILVNACWGLGEGIRGGEIAGDVYTVRRSSGETLGCRPGSDVTEIALDPERSGTIERELAAGRRGRRCLDDDQLALLAELARSLDARTGRGQDVEFGFDDEGRLWLFQLRRAAGCRAVKTPQPGGTKR